MKKNIQSNSFCTNCGKNGHLYHSCKKPITSSGIICFRKNKDNKFEYLMICRKDSLGYVDFLRGKYPLHYQYYIQNLINEMTIEEKEKLLNNEFSTLWTNLWGNYTGSAKYVNEEKISKQKFNSIKEGVNIYNSKIYSLKSLIHDSNTNWIHPEWGFPKGRRNYMENDITCSIREFEEETGISKNDILLIKNILPYEEIFMGSNFKSYKHKYYLAYMDHKNDDMNFQTSEVSNMKWMTIEDCIKKIRPYNLERTEIIIKIENMLNKYSLIL